MWHALTPAGADRPVSLSYPNPIPPRDGWVEVPVDAVDLPEDWFGRPCYYDAATRTVRPDRDAQALIELRRERDALLAASDHLFLSDRSFEDERDRTAWVAYRQTLRDLPAQPKPVIPAAPTAATMRSA